MAFLCCVESIHLICMTLDYNVFCRVTSEDVISMSLFMVLGTIGRDDVDLLLPLDSDDLPCHHAPVSLCQCDVPARQGLVPSELGYGYFCGNIVGEDDAWVSLH
jgi:hypothetical protein